MTEQEWKEKLVKKISVVKDSYQELMDHISDGDKIDCDKHELIAFMTIKLKKLEVEIEEMVK